MDTQAHTHGPPLKWVGGKRQLAAALMSRLQPPAGRFFEPFAGGAFATFTLAPRAGVLADKNARLMRCYSALREDAAQVVEQLEAHALHHARDPETYYYQTRAAPPDDRGDADVAAWLIYVLRTCFNGLYRENRAGQMNAPKGDLDDPERIAESARLLAAAVVLRALELRVGDFADTAQDAQAGDVIYYDPPYLPDRPGGFTGYLGGFAPSDHVRLEALAWAQSRRGVEVWISNSGTERTLATYPPDRWCAIPVQARRSVSRDGAGRGPVTEVLLRPIDAQGPPLATAAFCGCGCGKPVEGGRLYVDGVHRQRAWRARQAEEAGETRQAANARRQADRLEREAAALEQEAAERVLRATQLRTQALRLRGAG